MVDPHGPVYEPCKFLVGFMDDAHLQHFAGELRARAAPHVLPHWSAQVARARLAADGAPAVSFANTLQEPVQDSPLLGRIQSHPLFQRSVTGLSHSFNHVDLAKLVTVQFRVRPDAYGVDATPDALMRLAFPEDWSAPVDAALSSPHGPLMLSSRHPCLSGDLHIALDAKSGQLTISPPRMVNVLKVAHYQGRYFLLNGYHRAYACLAAGISKLPALVIQATRDEHVGTLGSAFRVPYLLERPRPPLLSDFLTEAAVEVPWRARLFTTSVSLDIRSAGYLI